jgi:hypothetical protein
MAWFIRRFPQRQSVRDASAGRHLRRRGAVVGCEAVGAGEAGDVADVAEHGSGHCGADPEDVRHRRARGPDRRRQLLDIAPLDVDAAQVGEITLMDESLRYAAMCTDACSSRRLPIMPLQR